MIELTKLCSALGLSGAAGLNAYIPLLTLAILQNRGIAHLSPPYDALGSGWCIAVLVLLLIVEIIVDKVPGADHINDIIMTAVRPAAGALLFAAQADSGVLHSVHPAVWIILGVLLSGSVHGAKAVARPVVNVSTAGIGAPVVSTIEDLVSTVLSIVAIVAPFLAAVLVGVFAWLMWKSFRWFFSRERAVRVLAVPVDVPIVAPMAEGEQLPAGWGGGV